MSKPDLLVEAREIICAMVNDLALRAKLRSGFTGLEDDAALDISDGILQRAQEFLKKVKP